MGRQKLIHLNSTKQGDEFLRAMANVAEYNEIIIQHKLSGEGETSLWTLESVNGAKTPVRFLNENAVSGMVDEETARAISAETALQEEIDNIEVKELTPSSGNILKSYGVFVNDLQKGVIIDIPKNDTDSVIDRIITGWSGTTIDENTGNIISSGDGQTEVLIIIYKDSDGKYKSTELNYDDFIQENEFKDGLIINNHVVKVLIDSQSDNYLTVSENGVLLSGVSSEITRLNNKIDDEIARAQSAETLLNENIQNEIDRALSAETELQEILENEITEISADTVSELNRLDTKIDNEIDRALSVETELSDIIDEISADTASEREERINSDTLLEKEIDNEIIRAISAETILAEEIDAEIERAQSAETLLSSHIDNEKERATNVETILAEDINFESERAQSAETILSQSIEGINANILTLFDGVEYNSSAKTIEFYHGNTLLDSIDATDFIKDGMVNTVEIREVSGQTYLVVVFNTESGKEDIYILITEIFDASNYYTKNEVDNIIDSTNDKINALSGKTIEVIESIDNETERAQSAETILNESIINETERALSAETELQEQIYDMDADLVTEIDRAMTAESNIQQQINTINEYLENLVIDCGTY